jgi:hypothetical protein
MKQAESSSDLKMEVTCSIETSVDFQQATHHNIPEDRTLQIFALYESVLF